MPSTHTPNFTMLLLTCGNKAEAERISMELLKQSLIACSKMSTIHSLFSWEGAIQGSDEILLIMETTHDLCGSIEQVVRQLHSYETFVMVGLPMTYISPQAREWLQSSLVVKF
jgi:periplasmic divalent cation tolerance protein